jgi:sulfatase maturation enzyme AslB (radical SAM superfamily)
MTQKMYDKQYSFEELRSDRNGDEIVLARVRTVQSNIATAAIDESKKDLLTRACDDILSLPPFTIQPGRLSLQRHTIDEILRLPDAELPRYLVYRYRYETFPQTYTIDDFPPLLQIEPISLCNYRCVFCYQVDKSLSAKGSEHMGTMSLELFKAVIDQAQGNIEAVTLASRGEPLLNPKIKEMLAYCHGKFLGLKINTNASKLTEAICHAILEADINTLVISADAAKEPLYSQLRVNGKLKTVLANVTRFHEIRAKHYPQTRTILRVSGVHVSDEQNLDDMEGLWKGLADQVSFTRYMPWERTYTLPLHGMQTPCSDLWRRMFVWWDAKVNPCDNDYLSKLSVGDARHASIHELWTGQAYQDIRDKHLNAKRGEASPCNRCNFT